MLFFFEHGTHGINGMLAHDMVLDEIDNKISVCSVFKKSAIHVLALAALHAESRGDGGEDGDDEIDDC